VGLDLETYANSVFGNIPVAEIATAHGGAGADLVKKPETASRLKVSIGVEL
jgi:hypothetical protein